jgi:hypothetical protein
MLLVWIRSLVNACHIASSNKRSNTISLCVEGKRPSKTGIMHFGSGQCPGSELKDKHEGHYLQNIFEIATCQLLHGQDIISKTSDSSTTKCWNLTKPGARYAYESNQFRSTYLAFKVWILSCPSAYNTRRRCMNVAFHTPSSNLCRRSTMNIE